MTCQCCFGGGLTLCFFNEGLKGDHSTLLGIRTRRSFYNHALAGTADLGGAYLVPDKEMLRWYLTDSGLTAFEQPLADQGLRELSHNLNPSGVE